MGRLSGGWEAAFDVAVDVSVRQRFQPRGTSHLCLTRLFHLIHCLEPPKAPPVLTGHWRAVLAAPACGLCQAEPSPRAGS